MNQLMHSVLTIKALLLHAKLDEDADSTADSTFAETPQSILVVGEALDEWLDSFDTDSASKCFEAVNILKEELNGIRSSN